METSEKICDESSSDGVVSFMTGSELLESKYGTVTMELGSGGNEVRDSVDDVEKVMESRLDGVVSNWDVSVSNGVKVGTELLGLETDGGGGGVVHDLVDDGRVSGGERTSVMKNDEKVLDSVVLSVPLSNSDIAVSNGVEVGAMQPVSDNDRGGGIDVHDSVDDAKVFEDEKMVMEKAEKVSDESSSDAVVSSVPPSNSDIAFSNEVEVRADLLKSNTESQTKVPSIDHEGDVGMVVHDSVNDVRVSGDEREIVMENTEKVLNESSSDAGVLSVPPSHSDISASNMVKNGAESLDSKTGDEKEIEMTDVEKVLDENEVNDEEKEGKYKVTDLVWAKVKNYPWWPGQIFDPSASTDKAKKFSNKKGFLIAYFGDQSFAWNKVSNIKPFRKNFPKMEKQSKSKAFHHAVNCALDEVSRRIDFGLTCSCLSKEVYNNIKSQVFVNAGIKKEASEIEGGDNFSTVSTFKPVNIVQSVQDLAREHFDGIGRLEVLSVRTQILAYFRWKGYNQFSTQFLGGLDDKLEDNSERPLMEEDKVVEDAKPASISAKVSSKKRKLNGRDTGHVVLNDKSEDDSELSLMEQDKVVEDEKPISVSAKISSKKKKLNGDSGDSVPRRKEKGLKNVILKGKSTVKSKSKKNSGDSGDSALDDKLEDEPELPLMEDDKVVEDAKLGAKASSKRKKLDACDSGDSVPRKKEQYLKNVTQKENSNVKSKSKKNSEKKVTIESGFKEKSRSATDDRKLPISPPKKLFRIGDTICRIAKQLSESPSILKKEPMKSRNDEKSVEQTEPPSIHKKKSKKSKNDKKCVEQTESPPILKKESKKSKNDEKSVEQTDPTSMLKKESKKSENDKKCVEQTESPSILKKESKKSKNDEKSVEQTDPTSMLKKESKKSKNDEKSLEQSEPPSIPKKESKKSKKDEKSLEQSDTASILKKESKNLKTDEKCVEQTELPLILEKEFEKSKDDEKCVEQSKENSKTSKENSATALILNFTNVDSIPSLAKLNEIFRCYGTVRETDTEILEKNNCAKVVFNEKSDAETAFSSAGKFSVFGPSLISYRLDYSPTLRKIYTRNKKRNRKEREVGETSQSEDVAA